MRNRGNAAAEQSAPSQPLAGLVDEFGPALANYFARRVGNNDEVPDLVQEVFVRLVRREEVVHMGGLRGYVFETAHSVMVDWLRRRDVRRAGVHESFDPDLHGDTDFASDRVLMDREDLSRVIAALMELPERTRAIFVLRRIEAMKFKDIASRLGVSVSTAEKEMARAMVHLLERFEEE